MSVQTKLLTIQNKLKAPKNQYNSFGKYKYRNCEDILEALKPILKEERATIIISDELVEIGGKSYIKANAVFTDADDEKSVCVSAFAREEGNKKGMDACQMTGCASSYARKYALNGLFAIDDNKDSDFYDMDSTDNLKSSLKKAVDEYCEKEKVTPEKVKEILVKELNIDLRKANTETIKNMINFLKRPKYII